MVTNYVGYKVRVDTDELMPGDVFGVVEFDVKAVEFPEGEEWGCDFCSGPSVAKYELDATSVLGDAGQNTLYCQEHAKLADREGPDEWVSPLKMYVACRQCGEVFDDLTVAHGHAGTCGSDQGWDVVTEDEAF